MTDKLEAQEAKRDGATLTKNSGRGKIQKGDAILGPFTIDYKHFSKGFTVNQSNWAKLRSDAFTNRTEYCAFKLILGEENPTRLYVIDEDTFNEFYAYVVGDIVDGR